MADRDRAFALLAAGQLQEGAHLLGALAAQTGDDQLRSQCLHGLGQVLDRLGEADKAYEIWYRLAHKPAGERNWFDLSARMQVMRLFDAQGLRLRPPDFPPRVQIEVTSRCNLRCIMCTRNQMRRTPSDMSWEVFRRVADECSSQPGAVMLLFFLGEPLMHSGLEDMVAYLASIRDRTPVPMTFGIQTNGMLLDADKCGRLLTAGLRDFHFSLDALGGDLELIRPGVDYGVVERNILHLLSLRAECGRTDVKVEISKLCDDPHADEVRRFLRVWEPRVDCVHLLPINKVAGNEFLDATGTVRSIGRASAGGARHYCGQGQRLIVLANGDYAFCHGDIDGQLGLGNVLERSIRDAWNSAEMRTLRDRIAAGDYQNLSPCAACPLGRAEEPGSGAHSGVGSGGGTGSG